jgi:TonB family protein
MSAMSSAASITIHAAVAAALLMGVSKAGRTAALASPPIPPVVFIEPTARSSASPAAPGVLERIDVTVELGSIRIPVEVLHNGALGHTTPAAEWMPTLDTRSGAAGGWSTLAATAPEVLSGPLPVYPDLLRQAGVTGQVVLQARVDSSGRVERGSIRVISASHPGFVGPARQALVATLFRPGRMNGRAVPTLVRVPFAFSIRDGTGRAR